MLFHRKTLCKKGNKQSDRYLACMQRLVQRMALSLGKVDEAQMDSPFQAKLEVS